MQFCNRDLCVGFGSEEDSLTSWLGGNSLEPQPPRYNITCESFLKQNKTEEDATFLLNRRCNLLLPLLSNKPIEQHRVSIKTFMIDTLLWALLFLLEALVNPHPKTSADLVYFLHERTGLGYQRQLL
jgi:hypothetical protein